MTERMTMSTVTVTVESDPIDNPFKPDTTPGIIYIILLATVIVIAFVFFLTTLLCPALIIIFKKNVLEIQVGNQTFRISKNDVPLTDLLAKFNHIISSTADHIRLDHETKLVIKELQKIITNWEIEALKDSTVRDHIKQDSRPGRPQPEFKWFASVLPALNELMKK